MLGTEDGPGAGCQRRKILQEPLEPEKLPSLNEDSKYSALNGSCPVLLGTEQGAGTSWCAEVDLYEPQGPGERAFLKFSAMKGPKDGPCAGCQEGRSYTNYWGQDGALFNLRQPVECLKWAIYCNVWHRGWPGDWLTSRGRSYMKHWGQRGLL